MSGAASEQAVVETIAAVYDAALSAEAWPVVLARLAGLFRCHFADLFTRSHDRLRYAGLAHGLDREDYQGLFLDTWFKRNVWGLSRPTRVEGEILTTREMLEPAVLKHSEIYTDYLAPRGFHEGLRLALWADADGIQDISLLRPWSAGAFTAAERELAATLLPHLQKAVAITRRLARDEAISTASLMALSAAGLGAILIDADGRPILANALAERMSEQGDVLVIRGDEIRTVAHAGNRPLRQAILRAIDPKALARSSTTLRLARARGGRPLVAVVVPLSAKFSWTLPQQPAAVILLSDPGARAGSSAQFARAFDLTGAEAELAQQLSEGRDLRDIATLQGRSIHTLRNHLARLMAKTDTSRQAELVRLLGAIPTEPAG